MTTGRKAWPLITTVVLAAGAVFALRGPRREDVSFANGDVLLSGTLYVPRTAGPHPAIVFLHGSGDDDRENYRFYADLFAAEGFAALIYDKRGVGRSGGSWRLSPFGALADDAQAAVRYLAGLPSVDSGRIGVWGGSEGATIAAWIATRAPEIAFVVLQSFSGVTFAEQNLYQNERALRACTESPDDVAAGLRVVALQARMARTGEGWQEYAEAKAAIRDLPWASALGGTAPADSWWWGWYRTKIDFDPVPVLERLRMPVFAAWGENDAIVPVPASRRAVEAALARGGHRDVTCVVYPNADHSLQAATASGTGPNRDYLRDLVAWSCKQAKLAP